MELLRRIDCVIYRVRGKDIIGKDRAEGGGSEFT